MDGKQKPQLLRMSEVQQITALGRATCYAKAGVEFPAIRIGRSVRVPADALQAWIEKNTMGGNVSESR